MSGKFTRRGRLSDLLRLMGNCEQQGDFSWAAPK